MGKNKMTEEEQVKKKFLKYKEKARLNNIFVQEGIKPNSDIRGVYGFFAVTGQDEIPFYIGKSNNIFNRMFGKGDAHIYSYLRGVRKTDVQKRIEDYLGKGYVIEVRILKKIRYKGDSFIQDANRLALAELKEIVKQQNKGFCITEDQISEAVKQGEEDVWNNRFVKNKIGTPSHYQERGLMKRKISH